MALTIWPCNGDFVVCSDSCEGFGLGGPLAARLAFLHPVCWCSQDSFGVLMAAGFVDEGSKATGSQ